MVGKIYKILDLSASSIASSQEKNDFSENYALILLRLETEAEFRSTVLVKFEFYVLLRFSKYFRTESNADSFRRGNFIAASGTNHLIISWPAALQFRV